MSKRKSLSVRETDAVAQMAGKSPFSKLGPVVEQEVKKEAVAKDPQLVRLLEIYARIIRIEGYNKNVQTAISGLASQFSASEIERFCLSGGEETRYNPELFGSMVSRLIDLSPDQEFTPRVDHLQAPPEDLCHGNRKQVCVIGDTRDRFCDEMKGGEVILKGMSLVEHADL